MYAPNSKFPAENPRPPTPLTSSPHAAECQDVSQELKLSAMEEGFSLLDGSLKELERAFDIHFSFG